jgi:hypothetical protein
MFLILPAYMAVVFTGVAVAGVTNAAVDGVSSLTTNTAKKIWSVVHPAKKPAPPPAPAATETKDEN